MLSGLHHLENIVGTPQSLLLSSIPLSGCSCTHQEQGTPCLPKSTGRDIHEQALAQQWVCGHCKGRAGYNMCSLLSKSAKHQAQGGNRTPSLGLQGRNHRVGASVGWGWQNPSHLKINGSRSVELVEKWPNVFSLEEGRKKRKAKQAWLLFFFPIHTACNYLSMSESSKFFTISAKKNY